MHGWLSLADKKKIAKVFHLFVCVCSVFGGLLDLISKFMQIKQDDCKPNMF